MSENVGVQIENPLFGRTEIITPVEEITRNNVCDVLGKALLVHQTNSFQIDYLYRYMKGEQPILTRAKKVRPEICNKIVENHAAEIAQFTSGYFLGEPLTYVRRGEREQSSNEITTLNDFMFFENKASRDKEIATWMAIGGVGYRMVLPRKNATEDDAPFMLDSPDPRYTFVVYNAGCGKRRVMGVREVYKEQADKSLKVTYCGYTRDHYFEVEDSVLKKWEAHSLGDIPIFEYRLNMTRMGSFEPAVPLLDAINTIMSNRVDGIEQFIQSFLKFKNCEIDDTGIKRLRELGAIIVKSTQGVDSDVDIVSQELNQAQTQTLVDYIYEQVLVICGMPTTTKGGASTSDTGAAVFLRDGWSQCEARAKDTELLFEESERSFLRLTLSIIRTVVKEFNLSLREVDYKFTRRQHDNLLTKTQSLLQMLEAGLAPEVAIATSGLFNDPMDVAEQSKRFLRKWDYKESVPARDTPSPTEDQSKKVETEE